MATIENFATVSYTSGGVAATTVSNTAEIELTSSVALTKETLGVDVIAVGMPTVVYAATLARDAFAAISDSNTDDDALASIERELLGKDVGEMIVTPREIDALVKNAAVMISAGLNRALHPQLSPAEIAAMMD
jgi:spore protease